MLPILDPIPRGIAMALGSVAVASLGAALAFSTFPTASPELLENIAMIGGALIVAYAVEAAWLARRAEADDEYEEWLGFATGAGIAGLIGIAVALLTSEHLAYGHASFIDDLGLAWATVSLVILGFVLVAQPLLASRYGGRDPGDL